MNKSLFVTAASGIVCLAVSIVLSGCGSSSSPPPASRVTISLSAGSAGSAPTVNAGQSVTILAVVVNASGNSGVKWSLSGAGSLGSKTSTSVVYSAPDSLTAATTAIVTATSASDSSETGTINITVNPGPPLPISISVGGPGSNNPASTIVDSPLAVTATVKNDPKNAGVQWSLTGPGSLTNETITSVTYNTPANVLPNVSPGTPVVTATSITDPSVSASLGVALLPLLAFCGVGPGSFGLCSLPTAVYNHPYTANLNVSGFIGGGIPPYHWTGSPPPNLTISPNGVISGTLLYPGPSSFPTNPMVFYIAVSDSTTPVANTGSADFSMYFAYPTTLTIMTSSLPESSVGASYNQTMQVTAGTAPYSWNVNSGSLPPGLSINPTIGAITGSPTTAGTFNFAVEVTDSATPVPETFSANFSITIQPQLAFSTTSLPPGSAGTAYAQTLQATGAVPPYTFALQNGSSLPAGLSLFSEIAGVPTTTGTTNFTVVATDSQGTTATGNMSITIAAANCAGNSSLQGNYAFLFSSYAPPTQQPSAFNYVGSFVADGNGNVTQGYVDFAPGFPVGVQTGTLTGTYCISGNVGTLVLTGFVGGGPITNTFHIVLQASGNGNAAVYENPQPSLYGYLVPGVSGVLLKQAPADFNLSNIAGEYIFSLMGCYSSSPSAQAGAFTANGTSSLSNGELDLNNDGNLTGAAPFTANDLAVSSTGRGTVTLNAAVGGAGSLSQLSLVFYVVNSSELLALEEGDGDVLAGQIVQQTGSSFSNSSLNGSSVVGLSFSDFTHLPAAQVGVITWDGNGNFTWAADQNDAGTMSSLSFSGTYNVASDGRVTLSTAGLPSSPILYLSGQNQGFIIGTDTGVTSGLLFSQSGSPYSAGSFSGAYAGGNLQLEENLSLEADTLSADGVINVTGTLDQSNYNLGNGGNGPASIPVSGTYSVSSNGRGTITQNGSVTNIFYIISPTQILMMTSGNPIPDIVSLSH